MSTNLIQDIADMHTKFGVNDVVREFDQEQLHRFLLFRIACLNEEFQELLAGQNDPEQIVDAIIDWIVFGIGTLDAFDVDAQKAWDAVHEANMSKEPGIKPNRPNPFGLPDLIKPTMETHGHDWVPPSHEGNHGLLTKALNKETTNEIR